MRKRLQKARARTVAILAVLGVTGIALALFTSSVFAGYESVGSFASGELAGEEAGVAVNATGAGGVPAGSVYVVSEGGNRVARYAPLDVAEPLREAWGWGVAEGGASGELETCGPDGALPNCNKAGIEGEGPGQIKQAIAVAVDQSTGNVYVLGKNRQTGVIQEFSADGSKLIASFGESAPFGAPVTAEPGKVHAPHEGGLAVGPDGTVYVTDTNSFRLESRIMTFKPETPGDVEHYVYAGQGAAGLNAGWLTISGEASDLYASSEEKVYEFNGANLSAPSCERTEDTGGLRGLAVDEVTREVFVFRNKGQKEIHQLGPCDAAGEFPEVGTTPVIPKTSEVHALVFDPSSVAEVGRPPGVLYAVDTATREGVSGLIHIFAGTPGGPPTVEGEAATRVGVTSANVQANVDPGNLQTTFVVQYLTDAQFGSNGPGDRFAGALNAPSGGPVAAGSGTVAIQVAAPLAGLTPETKYHFRIVATNADGSISGAGATFRTYAPPADGNRAYEMVSPADKHGGEVFPLIPGRASCGEDCKPGIAAPPFPRQVTVDGDGIVYEGFAFSPNEGAAVFNEYLARRTASGWQTTNVSPPLMGTNAQGYKGFDEDLSRAVLYQINPSLTPDAPAGYANLYSQSTAAPGGLTPLVNKATPIHRPSGGALPFEMVYGGASSDFARTFFGANDALTLGTALAPRAAEGTPKQLNLYEQTEGQLKLINVLPGNASTVPGAHFGAKYLSTSNHQESVSDLSHAISTDGTHVYWSDEAGQVYLREDGQRTIKIPDASLFLTASSNGAKVVLRDGQLYDTETRVLTDLSGGRGGFQGIAGQSDDLSTIYLVDTAVLTGQEANNYGAKAEPGSFNLYAWHAGTYRYVASLLEHDNQELFGGDWHFTPAERTAEASPDGRWLSFMSSAALKPDYENSGPCGGGGSTAPCPEVYLYDSASGQLRCASCDPSEESPLGRSDVPLLEATVGTEDPPLQPQYVTNSGRLFFDSQDSLSASDTNGAVEDVYEFVLQGIHGCEDPTGCTTLVSGGRGSGDSNFAAIDPSGQNVFFTTRDRLVPEDHDSLIDLYDAREGGGVASQTVPRECLGDTCQAQMPAPVVVSPGSLTVHGEQATKPKHKCKKGRVRRNARCVKKFKHSKHKDRKAHKHRWKAGADHQAVDRSGEGGKSSGKQGSAK